MNDFFPRRTMAAFLLVAFLSIGAAQAQQQGFVSSAHPLATEAGLEVLRRGGNAVDAAIAVEAMLGLVEPQSSGLGGGGFMMVFDAASGEVSAYAGRERAPMGADARMFLDAQGHALPRRDAMLSGRATGVPGAVAVLHLAHERHGALPWRRLFDETIVAARAGFTVTPRLARYIHGAYAQSSAPDVRRYFTGADGALLEAGDTLRNPAYARFVERLAHNGPRALYRGETARRIVARTGAEPLSGAMTLDDLAAYEAEEIEALCRPYRAYVLCAPSPPASGVGLLYVMGLLERTDIAARGPEDPQAWFLFAEASRVMYADRDHFVGDPRFVSVPVEGLLAPAYLDARAALIGEQAHSRYEHGAPAGAPALPSDQTLEPAGTTHFVVVDGQGNVVSMTATVESYFGSGRMVDGFFLNNQMTDFSFDPVGADGAPAANAVAGGKRPRSSMTPVIILNQDGALVGAVGSPGGNAIPAYVAKTLVGVLDWGLTMQQAIDLPNLLARGEAFNGEAHLMPAAVTEGLAARGIEVRRGSGEESGLHGFILRDGAFDGGADPRREGEARAHTLP
jgi:gamma-glutamyltranspeptidase/glutathione hydrolase